MDLLLKPESPSQTPLCHKTHISDLGLLFNPFTGFPKGTTCESPPLDFPMGSFSTHQGPTRPSFSESLPVFSSDFKTTKEVDYLPNFL